MLTPPFGCSCVGAVARVHRPDASLHNIASSVAVCLALRGYLPLCLHLCRHIRRGETRRSVLLSLGNAGTVRGAQAASLPLARRALRSGSLALRMMLEACPDSCQAGAFASEPVQLSASAGCPTPRLVGWCLDIYVHASAWIGPHLGFAPRCCCAGYDWRSLSARPCGHMTVVLCLSYSR